MNYKFSRINVGATNELNKFVMCKTVAAANEQLLFLLEILKVDKFDFQFKKFDLSKPDAHKRRENRYVTV